jgi:hypothetical protein
LSFFPLLFFLGPQHEWCSLTLVRSISSLLSLLIQMLVSSGNTLTHLVPVFNQLAGYALSTIYWLKSNHHTRYFLDWNIIMIITFLRFCCTVCIVQSAFNIYIIILFRYFKLGINVAKWGWCKSLYRLSGLLLEVLGKLQELKRNFGEHRHSDSYSVIKGDFPFTVMGRTEDKHGYWEWRFIIISCGRSI